MSKSWVKEEKIRILEGGAIKSYQNYPPFINFYQLLSTFINFYQHYPPFINIILRLSEFVNLNKGFEKERTIVID